MDVSTPAPARRGRPATVATRVLETTERLLDDGERFTDIPVERLLNEADVSRSSFYANFPDKSALLLKLAERTITEVAASSVEWWHNTHALGPEAAAETVLKIIKLYRKHKAVIACLAEVAAYDDEVRHLWRAARESFATNVAAGLREERATGLVPADLDLDRTASYITLMVDAAVLDHVQNGASRDDRKVAAALARIGWVAYYTEL